jgi:cytochrome c biogenesis protein CcmG/thiol:disulfide interchange protein DsbE
MSTMFHLISRSAARFARAAVAFAAFTPLAACGAAATEQGANSAADPGGFVGNPAPDFHVKAVNGSKGTIALKDMRGQVVLVDFWGTFCEPCKKSFPKLQELSGRYASSGFHVVAISEDEAEDKDKIPAFADTYGAKFALGWDADKAIARQYKPDTMPSSFVIDRNGVVRYVHVGFHDGEELQIEKEIKELLGR